jgi:alkyl sulfatase BDS1-like metallo-beta-lactamase superfamily hydrolase
MAEAGHVAWNIGKYDFLLEEGKDFDSIHPSLQRFASGPPDPHLLRSTV